MTRYITFIRGVNGGLVMKMEALRQLFDSLGFRNIKTILATGNVIFEANGSRGSISKQIEQAFARQYNYKTMALLYTMPEFQQLIESEPFRGMTKTIETSHHVSFVAKHTELPFKLPYAKPEKGYTILRQTSRAIYSLIDLSGKTRPDIVTVLDRIFDKQVTTRNWQTVERCYKALTG